MSNVRVALANVVDKVPNVYNTNERWVVKKMKPKYVNKIVAIMSIIYKKDKVQYFNNKSTMMISKVDHEEFMNWVVIMYF
jgi:DNA replicative helicase MCM subunit Mcm2 (Cdc46/Mcm family)